MSLLGILDIEIRRLEREQQLIEDFQVSSSIFNCIQCSHLFNRYFYDSVCLYTAFFREKGMADTLIFPSSPTASASSASSSLHSITSEEEDDDQVDIFGCTVFIILVL